MNIQEESARYRKKKPSNLSKSSKKSDHKHKFEPVLLEYQETILDKDRLRHCLGKRCQVCGLIKLTSYFISEPCGNSMYRMLEDSEIVAKYKDLPLVSIPNGIYGL